MERDVEGGSLDARSAMVGIVGALNLWDANGGEYECIPGGMIGKTKGDEQRLSGCQVVNTSSTGIGE
jgi:hypothetical protein